MQKEILKNEVYLFVGPLEFKILKGKLEAVGCILQHKTHIQLLHTIPAGKSIPFECHKDSIIQIQSGDINNIKPLEKSTIPVQWDKLVARIKDKNLKRIIVLGEMDTGKSFFITYLANKLIQLKRKVGVIDSDLGQSDVGPPGTIAFTVLKEPILLLSDAAITGMEFVGSHSPGLHMVPTLVQFSKIMNQCLKMCDIMLVNTSGWVLGDGGRLLSRSKIDILDPDIIVLMQKEDECEHLVKTVFSKDMLIRLRASRKVLDTSKGDREKLRNLSSQKYFQNSKEMTLPLDKIETDKCFFKTGKSINDIASFTDKNILFAEKYPVFEGVLIITDEKMEQKEIELLNKNGYYNIRNLLPGFSDGALVGLRNKNNELLDLGIIKNIDFLKKKICINTPFKGKQSDIRIIQFGSLKYRGNGTENGFFEPGSF